MQIENTADLRQMLIETIDGVRKGTVEPRQAQAIASLSTKILHSAKLDLEVLRYNAANKDTVESGNMVLQLVAGTSGKKKIG